MREHGAQVDVFDELELERVEPRSAPDRIVVAGGDGSIAPAARAAGQLDVPLAVVPAGTANDFARTNGLPEDPLDAAVLAVTGQDAAPARARPPRRRTSVRQRRQRRSRLGGGPLRGAVQARARAARLRRRRAARRGDRGAAALHAARGRRRAVRRRRLAGDRGRHRRVRRRLGAGRRRPRATECSTSPCCPRARGSRSRAGRGGCGAGRSPSRGGWSTTAASWSRCSCRAGTELNVDGELRDGGLERVTVEPSAYALVVPGS